MTTSVLPSLTQAEKIFHDLIWAPAIKAGELALEGAVPVLALPIIKQLDEGAIQALSDWMFTQLKLVIDLEAVRLIDAAHQSAYESASLRLKIAAQESGPDSDAYRKVRDEALEAMRRFTHFPAA